MSQEQLPEPSPLRGLPPQMRSLARLPRGRRMALVKGQDAGRFMDFYHQLLTVSWPTSQALQAMEHRGYGT